MRRALLACSLVFPLSADGLSDLKTSLARFQGQDTIKAQAEIQAWSSEGEGKKQKQHQSNSSVSLEDGPQGLKLGWSAQQIQAAQAEGRAKASNPESPTPNMDALRSINAEDAARSLQFSSELLNRLQSAKLLEEKNDTFLGKPAHLMVFKLEPNMDPEERKMMKSFNSTLKVWVDPEGTPLGLEESTEIKLSKFLITVTATNREVRRFQKVGSRLVSVETTEESGGSALGQSGQSKTVVKLSLQ